MYNTKLKYYILHHLLFYAIANGNFLLTLPMNKFTSIVIPTSIYVMNYLQSLVYSTSYVFYNETLSWMVEIWMKNDLISDNNCNVINL